MYTLGLHVRTCTRNLVWEQLNCVPCVVLCSLALKTRSSGSSSTGRTCRAASDTSKAAAANCPWSLFHVHQAQTSKDVRAREETTRSPPTDQHASGVYVEARREGVRFQRLPGNPVYLFPTWLLGGHGSLELTGLSPSTALRPEHQCRFANDPIRVARAYNTLSRNSSTVLIDFHDY